jgi:hypothetical protein
MSELMPFNDPHTAAPNLWAWRQEEHWAYECSAATFLKSRLERKAMECFLLWKYRLEKGESTLSNHGRFIRITKSPVTDQKIKEAFDYLNLKLILRGVQALSHLDCMVNLKTKTGWKSEGVLTYPYPCKIRAKFQTLPVYTE